ncbi:MAG: serine/threonine protein kinase [Myxococcales bacterium]|nr:serine/threonine protein kinase [Myxococcales bacterium]
MLGDRCPHDGSVLVGEEMLTEVPIGGRYRLIEAVAQGAYADVFVAADGQADRSRGRLVAIKRLLPHLRSDGDALARFDREGELLARLDGIPGVVHLVEHGRTDAGDPFLALEYLDGKTLEEVLDSYGRLPVDIAGRVVLGLLRVLDGVHRSGLVHRDLKPSNVMMLAVRERAELRLLDFGIARDPSRSDKRLTAPNRTFGTPNYMSPEQWGSASVDERSDLYSLGIIFYQMLTGHLPFAGDEVQVANQHRLSPVPPLDPSLNVPPAVAAALDTALVKVPEARHPDARAFYDALAEALGQPPFEEPRATQRLASPEPQRTRALPAATPTESAPPPSTRSAPIGPGAPAPPPLLSRRRLALGVAATATALVAAVAATAALGGGAGGGVAVEFGPPRPIAVAPPVAMGGAQPPARDRVPLVHGISAATGTAAVEVAAVSSVITCKPKVVNECAQKDPFTQKCARWVKKKVPCP